MKSRVRCGLNGTLLDDRIFDHPFVVAKTMAEDEQLFSNSCNDSWFDVYILMKKIIGGHET